MELPPSLTELLAGLQVPATERDPAAGPTPKAVAAALMRQCRLLELRFNALRDILGAFDFTFDWNTDDDLSVERDAGLHELDQAAESVRDLRQLTRWLWSFGVTRVIALDGEVLELAKGLAGSIAPWIGPKLRHVVEAAVVHLATEPNAAEIIAEVEQARDEQHRQEYGTPFYDKDRRGWPWTQLDGRPWPESGESQRAEVHAEAPATSDGRDGRRRPGRAGCVHHGTVVVGWNRLRSAARHRHASGLQRRRAVAPAGYAPAGRGVHQQVRGGADRRGRRTGQGQRRRQGLGEARE